MGVGAVSGQREQTFFLEKIRLEAFVRLSEISLGVGK